MTTDYKQRPDCNNLSHIPGAKGLPILGNTLDVIKDLEGFIQQLHRDHGKVSRIKLLNQHGLMVSGADNHQRIFLDREKNFSSQKGLEQSIGQFYSGCIQMTDFDEHKFLRRMMQTAFKSAAMKNYQAMVNPVVAQHLATWSQQPEVDIFPAVKSTLLAIGAKVFIGEEDPAEIERINTAFLNINIGLMGLIRKDLPGTKYRKGKRGQQYLQQYFLGQIAQRRQGDQQDMFSFMCREKDDDGNYFPNEMIIAQASFILFAAHDTTTSLLNHLLYYTALHPEWQQRLRSECESIGRGAGETLGYDDLPLMPVMDRVINEVLRMRPSVSLTPRRTINACEIDGHQVPADTMIFTSPIFNHYDPEFWSEPNTFDPDRFSEERAEHKRHSFSYLPFGGGAHKCIGMHFAVMLTKCFMQQLLTDNSYALSADFNNQFEWVPMPKPKGLKIHCHRTH
ncbi:cytochrome P450 [Sinobacterium norvegicum]|uniref:cytochrome P450 n=1 Tax=Sinobacterium norvegicum TaxID=1641715 RepID=UPI001F32AC10|nr:cytochrome P450 [Sinobacterium norvegicum]